MAARMACLYKGPAMYEELVRVPLVIAWPGRIRAGALRCAREPD